jgi:hypothetical protein
MKLAAIVLFATIVSQPFDYGAEVFAARPDGGTPISGSARQAADRSPPAVNLIAFVGRKIEARYVEPKPNEIPFDAEYFVRYEVLQVVFGSYPQKEISFRSYVHMGEPDFAKHEFGLVYVSEYEGRLIQQKYLFQAVYPTADMRWAGCGDPYARMPDIHRHGVKAEAVVFSPPVLFDTAGLSRAEVDRKYPEPFFRRERGKAICAMGNYPAELFQVMKEGYLAARGVFRQAGPRSSEPANPRHEANRK